jgi:SAM-dependent methyltransferase
MEEVHLWRGSPEQRAMRSQLARSGQFDYFDHQLNHPDWDNKIVLDFGGNAGNLLRDRARTIRPENYYCVDVLTEALAEGRKNFPTAHWVHYDRYNCSFNPDGARDVPVPDLGVQFDFILAYSVFTHTTREEMKGLIEQLQRQLAPNGILAFTFIDPHFKPWPLTYEGSNLRWRLEKFRETDPDLDIDQLLEQSRNASWCALVNGNNLYIESSGVWDDQIQSCITYHVYYSVKFLQGEFPGAAILHPVNREMQHCCITRRDQWC